MKNNKLAFLKITIVVVLGVATAIGCKKDQTVVEVKEGQKVENKS